MTPDAPEREVLTDDFLSWAVAHGVAVVPTAKDDPKRPQGKAWQTTPPIRDGRNVADVKRTALEHGRNLGVSAQGSPGVVVLEMDGAADVETVRSLGGDARRRPVGALLRVVTAEGRGDAAGRTD